MTQIEGRDTRAAAPLTATGIDGTITVDADSLTIRKGFGTRTFGVRGSHTLAIWAIADAQLDAPTGERRGALQVRPVRQWSPNGSLTEYTVTFTEQAAGEFERVHARLQELLPARQTVRRSGAPGG
ncbi:MAG TPA: hypothetical protein VM324_00955 [Egibacteraceae bacterium]|nr:hypothetical protein [Egibacteraceae bacterium]